MVSLQNLRRKKRYAEDPEYRKKRLAYNRAWWAAHYGVSLEDRAAILTRQGGVCAICKQKRPLGVDHCHSSGKVRGLLCRKCNLGLGLYEDDPNLTRAAAAYLEDSLREQIETGLSADAGQAVRRPTQCIPIDEAQRDARRLRSRASLALSRNRHVASVSEGRPAMHPRYAIFYTPPPTSGLARFGSGVIGYDCFEATEVPFATLAGMEPNAQQPMTVDPRRYGFHATIVPPFHLHDHSEDELVAAADHFASLTPPIPIGSLAVATLGDFIALVPVRPNAEIARLAATCLEAFDAYRAPLSAEDRERRLQAGLSPRQIELMDRWSYPFVLDQYRFHMTLTGALPEDVREDFRHALAQAFAARSRDTFELDAVSVMRQDSADARFRVLRRCRLRG